MPSLANPMLFLSMKRKKIKIGPDTYTVSIFSSTVRGNHRQQERWELLITNQYESQLLHTTLDGSLASFLEERLTCTAESLLMQFAQQELKTLSRLSRGV